jgi:hypothetical protein
MSLQSQGCMNELLDKYGLTVTDIVQTVEMMVKSKKDE